MVRDETHYYQQLGMRVNMNLTDKSLRSHEKYAAVRAYDHLLSPAGVSLRQLNMSCESQCWNPPAEEMKMQTLIELERMMLERSGGCVGGAGDDTSALMRVNSFQESEEPEEMYHNILPNCVQNNFIR